MKQKTKRYTLENHTPKALKDGNFLFFDHLIRNGYTILRTYNEPVDNMEGYCHHHSKECRITDLGKSTTLYMHPKTNDMLMECTIHALGSAFKRFTPEGYEVLEMFHP